MANGMLMIKVPAFGDDDCVNALLSGGKAFGASTNNS